MDRRLRHPVRCLALAVLAVFETGAGAVEQQRPLESSRFLGRGNTYVAAWDSDEATRGNPATLSEANVKFQLRWLQMDVMVGENTMDTVSEAMDLASTAEVSPISILETFADKFGKQQYLRAQVSPLALRILNFEFSPFLSSTSFVDMRVPTTPDVQFRSDTMAGANFAFAFDVGKTLNLGLTMRPAHRTVIAGDIQFSDLLTFVEDSDGAVDDVFKKEEGFQIGWDVGGIWRPGKDWRFGLLVENLGYAGNYSDFKDPPNPYQQRVNLGLAYRVDWKPWHWDMFADVHDLANPEQLDYFRLINLGTELGRSYVSRDHDLGLLLGLNEGYFTAGTFIDLWVTRLTMTYYAVELGEYAGQRSDRRWALTMLTSMTF